MAHQHGSIGMHVSKIAAAHRVPVICRLGLAQQKPCFLALILIGGVLLTIEALAA